MVLDVEKVVQSTVCNVAQFPVSVHSFYLYDDGDDLIFVETSMSLVE